VRIRRVNPLAPSPLVPGPAEGGVEDLVFEALERLESGGTDALDDLLASHPARASEVRARIEMLRAAGPVELGKGGAAPPAFPERPGDLRLLARSGGAGTGVVYRARQVSLGRLRRAAELLSNRSPGGDQVLAEIPAAVEENAAGPDG
jgi:hypothetical protein